MSDLVERLRGNPGSLKIGEIWEAADRIEALEKALREIAEHADTMRKGTDDWFELVEFSLAARNALGDPA